MDEDALFWLKLAKFAVATFAVGVVASMAGCPYYNVYSQHMEGKAQLAKAEYSKQILVEDAKARLESSKSLADAEVARAKGVAEANKIIGESLKNNESYLRYLWIHNLEEGDHDVIYIPTEANLPIFEAGGRFQPEAVRESKAPREEVVTEKEKP